MEKELNLKTELIKKNKTTYIVRGFLSNTDEKEYLYNFLEQHEKEDSSEFAKLAIKKLYERIIIKLVNFALQEIGKNAETVITIRKLSKGKKEKTFSRDSKHGTQYTLEINVFDFISNNKDDENKISYGNIEEILEVLKSKTYEVFLDELLIIEQDNNFGENFQNTVVDYKQNVLFEAMKGYADLKSIELEKNEEFLLSKMFLELFYKKNFPRELEKEVEEKYFINFFKNNYKNIIKNLGLKIEINTPEDDILGIIKEIQEKNLSFFNEMLSIYRADRALFNILFSMAKFARIANEMFNKMFNDIKAEKEEQTDSQQTC